MESQFVVVTFDLEGGANLLVSVDGSPFEITEQEAAQSEYPYLPTPPEPVQVGQPYYTSRHDLESRFGYSV